jgi:hypothetical protein
LRTAVVERGLIVEWINLNEQFASSHDATFDEVLADGRNSACYQCAHRHFSAGHDLTK